MNSRIVLLTLIALCAHAIALPAIVTTLTPVGNPVDWGRVGYIFGVAWCGDCDYLAVCGALQTSEISGVVDVYNFSSEQLNVVATATIPGGTRVGSFHSTAWCNGCNNLAVCGDNRDSQGLINIYNFASNTLTLIATATIPESSIFYSLAWCDDCSHLAAAGYNANHEGLLNVYNFDAGVLTFTATATIAAGGTLRSVSWCDDCVHLVAGGINSELYGLLNVYSFESGTLEWVATETIATFKEEGFYSVDWCGDCDYIAAGGVNENEEGLINIYHFTSDLLTLTATQTVVASSRFQAVAWCDECNYLAASGFNSDKDGLLNLYSFSPGQLSLIDSATITSESGIPQLASLSWCGDCEYIVTGEYNQTGDNYILLYRTGGSTIEAPVVQAQKQARRFPTQLDIINTLCWAAVTDAVAYNVYADADKTVQLAHITATPYCYSQHQIIPGKQKTYYVTAVDANGDESDPAIVTI